MALPLAHKTLRPHPVQSALYHDSVEGRVRFSYVIAGRGSGKTTIAKKRIVRGLLKGNAGDEFFYGLPTFEQARRVAWRDLKNLVPPAFKEYENDSNMVIRTTLGTWLYVFGMQAPERVEGMQWAGVVLDESSDQLPGMFDKSVRPALTEKKGWAWRIGVPKRFGVGAPEFQQACLDADSGKDSESKFYHWRSDTILDPKEIESAKNRLDVKDFEEQMGGEWVTVSGLVFHSFSDENIIPIGYDPDKPLIVGSDFNVNPMAWVIAQPTSTIERIPTDGIDVVDEIFLENANTLDTLRLLKAKFPDHHLPVYFYGDATAKSRHTNASISDYDIIFGYNGFPLKNVIYPDSNPAILDRIASVNAALRSADGTIRIRVGSHCANLIRDLKMQPWKVGSREPLQTDVIGHAIDALGYVVHSLIPMFEFEDHIIISSNGSNGGLLY